MKEALILSTIGGVYKVYCENKILEVKPRGIFRHKKIKLLIGDKVLINEEELMIEDVLERNNSLFRPRIANIDLGVVVVSLMTPSFSSYLLDKFLTLLNMSNIKPLIVLTKEDLMEDKNRIQEIVSNYALIGIKAIPFSKRTKLGLEEIKEEVKGKVIAFMGQTGVGKSSLINVLDPNFERDIGEYSIALGRGKHQTKEVILLPYENGFIADTPGFSSLELPIFKEDLSLFFPGFMELKEECKYTNCLHISEKECKVKEAIENGKLSKESYQNYLDIIKELKFRKDRY
ncbi:MAG: ribosome small subunit-dependent GTPase A [Erysipelotrichaceae bacterium]|nr:ribosome small subunit-dependent GTPase A [Erysipelotrichaceae bacterium]